MDYDLFAITSSMQAAGRLASQAQKAWEANKSEEAAARLKEAHAEYLEAHKAYQEAVQALLR